MKCEIKAVVNDMKGKGQKMNGKTKAIVKEIKVRDKRMK